MQDVDDEFLAALVTVQHHAVQNELPFFVTGAGLPDLPARLADARSYAERLFDYRQIGRLDPDQAAESLTVPADQMAQSYSDEALATVLDASGRYPYFIQEFGSAMWEVATTSPFTGDEAKEAVRVGQQRLDAGFFPSRWDRATPRERDYMNAMAADGEGPSTTGAIAARLGKKLTSLGPTRAQLIAKGFIYPPPNTGRSRSPSPAWPSSLNASTRSSKAIAERSDTYPPDCHRLDQRIVAVDANRSSPLSAKSSAGQCSHPTAYSGHRFSTCIRSS